MRLLRAHEIERYLIMEELIKMKGYYKFKDEPWICPQCGYEWVDPKDEWVDSESCELCKEQNG